MLPETAVRIVAQARERFGHIDTLINNAGCTYPNPSPENSTEHYGTVVGVDLTGFSH
jgi:NADP-dependent 3-hydroxy acid dehydrogenase YdfG